MAHHDPRDYVLGQIDLGQESTENQMNWIGEQLLGYGRIFSPNDVKRRLRQVTPGQIRAVAAATRGHQGVQRTIDAGGIGGHSAGA